MLRETFSLHPMIAYDRKKFNIYTRNNCNAVLIASVFFSTYCVYAGFRRKAKLANVYPRVYTRAPCHSQALWQVATSCQSRAFIHFPTPAVNQNGGMRTRRERKKYRRRGKRFIFIVLFSRREKTLYLSGIPGICVLPDATHTWTFIRRVSSRRVPRFYGQITAGMRDGDRQARGDLSRLHYFLNTVIKNKKRE